MLTRAASATGGGFTAALAPDCKSLVSLITEVVGIQNWGLRILINHCAIAPGPGAYLGLGNFDVCSITYNIGEA